MATPSEVSLGCLLATFFVASLVELAIIFRLRLEQRRLMFLLERRRRVQQVDPELGEDGPKVAAGAGSSIDIPAGVVGEEGGGPGAGRGRQSPPSGSKMLRSSGSSGSKQRINSGHLKVSIPTRASGVQVLVDQSSPSTSDMSPDAPPSPASSSGSSSHLGESSSSCASPTTPLSSSILAARSALRRLVTLLRAATLELAAARDQNSPRGRVNGKLQAVADALEESTKISIKITRLVQHGSADGMLERKITAFGGSAGGGALGSQTQAWLTETTLSSSRANEKSFMTQAGSLVPLNLPDEEDLGGGESESLKESDRLRGDHGGSVSGSGSAAGRVGTGAIITSASRSTSRGDRRHSSPIIVPRGVLAAVQESKHDEAIAAGGREKDDDTAAEKRPARRGALQRATSRARLRGPKNKHPRRRTSIVRPSLMAVRLAQGEVQTRLSQITRWDFDVLEFEELTNGKALSILAMILLEEKLGLQPCVTFNWDNHSMQAYLEELEANYCHDPLNANPYHKSSHAAEVVHAAVLLFWDEAVSGIVTSQLEALALVFGAAVHDFRHPGVNNKFLERTEDDIYLAHSGESTLERFHIAEAFVLLNNDRLNFMRAMHAKERILFRMLVTQVVLATDLSKGAALIQNFKTTQASKPDWRQDTGPRMQLLGLTLKLADVSHAIRPFSIHKRWSILVQEEFFMQGDKEHNLQLEVSPLCDRRSTDPLSKSQVGFFQFVVGPLVQAFASYYDEFYDVALETKDTSDDGTRAAKKRQSKKRHHHKSRGTDWWTNYVGNLASWRGAAHHAKEQQIIADTPSAAAGADDTADRAVTSDLTSAAPLLDVVAVHEIAAKIED